VVIDGHVLIDGGATNPLPFDLLRNRADVVVAVEISGPPDHTRAGIPNTIDAMYATVLVMTNAIISEKLKRERPDLLLLPHVGQFRTLDFFQASAILRIAEPVKAELKHKLVELLSP
jgi:NTE family protein